MSTLLDPARRTNAIEELLWFWLMAGTLAYLLFPPLRGPDPLLGWLPFWLIVAPLIDLSLLHRQRMAAAVSTFLVRRMHRQQPMAQARRAQRSRVCMPS